MPEGIRNQLLKEFTPGYSEIHAIKCALLHKEMTT